MVWRSAVISAIPAIPAILCSVLLGGEADRVLDRWEARVKELQSFTCRFRQEKKVSFMRRPLVSSGTMAYRDRRLLWKTEKPSPGFLSVDAKEVRIYTPEFKTLEIVELRGEKEGGAKPTSASAMSGAFPGFTGDFSSLRELYQVELLLQDGMAEGESRLRFTPRTEEAKKEVVAIEVGLDRELNVKSWRIVRTNGDELVLTISEFEAGAKVGDADLTFEVPPDAKIVRIGAPGAPGGAK
jgi:outer membrane lipoprotein-sorting protein